MLDRNYVALRLSDLFVREVVHNEFLGRYQWTLEQWQHIIFLIGTILSQFAPESGSEAVVDAVHEME